MVNSESGSMGFLLLLVLTSTIAHCISQSTNHIENVIKQKPALEVSCKMDGCATVRDPDNTNATSYLFLREFHPFEVENHTVSFYVFNKEYIEINCAGWNALDSEFMPQFINELHLSWLVLKHCPPPTNQSYIEAFAKLNVNIQDITALELKSLTKTPQLTADHLKDLYKVTELTIDDAQHENPEPQPDFLAPLKNLQILHVNNVKISAEDLKSIKNIKSLTQLHLAGKALDVLLVQE